MFNKQLPFQLMAPLLLICTVIISKPVSSQEATEDPPETVTDPMPEPAPAPESAPQPQTPVPAPAPENQPQTIVYAAPATATPQPQPETDPLVNLRKKPKKLRPIEGQEPPPGYVEVEKRKRGMIIAGAAVFGGFYIGSVLLSTVNRLLLIPIAGPMIAGFSYESNSEFTDNDDAEYSARLLGTFGTLFQTAGVTLFIVGLASKKKKFWLRQDIAGMSLQLTPTVVGHRDAGLGVYGTF